MSLLDRKARQFAEQYPEPSTDPVDRLRHTVDVFSDEDDNRLAVQATGNIYGNGVRTGLTWGDLRALLALLDGQR